MHLSPVSVILIVRNGERYIADALDSVVQSTVSPFEIVVVDDGSTDSTIAIAARYPLVRIVRREAGGIARAYNTGIAAARADLLSFISYDDLWLPEKLELHLTYMADHPDVDLTVSHVQHFLAADTEVPPGFRPELLHEAVPGFVPEGIVVRRRVFDTVGGFDESFLAGEDTDWFARVRDAGVRTTVLPQVLLRKRVHGSNAHLHADVNGHLLRTLRASVARKRRIEQQ